MVFVADPAAPLDTSATWLTPAVKGFSAASLFSDLGHELVTSLMPGFLTALGAPPIGIGLVEGISQLAQSGAGLWGGSIADGSGSPSRQQWVVVGYLATAAKALLALVFWWPWVIVIRTLAWTGRGMRGPIRNTLLSEEVPPAHRGKAFGFREALDTTGAVLGPVAALLLVAHWPTRTLFAWSAVPGLLAVIAVVVWVRDRHPRARHAKSPRPPMTPLFRRGLTSLARFQLGWVAPTLFILRVERAVTHDGVVIAIGFYVLHNLTYALGAYPAGALTDRIGPGRLLWMAGVLAVLVLAGFALPGTHLVLWAALFALAGIVTAFWETVRQPWLLGRMDEAVRGRGFGQVEASLGVSQLIANGVVTGIWTLVGPLWAFGAAAFLAAQGALALWQESHAPLPRPDGRV
jgi:MFS family permease